MNFSKVVLAALLAAVALLLTPWTVAADDVKFQYKFPCRPQDLCFFTQDDHSSNNDAYDFGIYIGQNQGLGQVRAVSEGIFQGYVAQDSVCTSYPSLGRYAEVIDIHGRTLRYAHLSSFGILQAGQRVLQGDLIGIEGNTGSTAQCAAHLHLSGIAGANGPEYIDGRLRSSLVHTHPHIAYPSTNSTVGAFNAPGAAIRAQYFNLGSAFTSWDVVGWTADQSGSGNGCAPSFPECRFYLHYWPLPAEGHWGSRQEFRTHPDSSGFGYRSIMAGRWAVDNAYLVEQSFYQAWYAGGELTGYNIGIPLMDRIGSSVLLCPASLGCLSYQRFHLGYIRELVVDGIRAFFCPDVWPPYPNQDYAVTASDIGVLVQKFGVTDPTAPYEPWSDAWYDLNGDGGVTAGDIGLVVAGFGRVCYPLS